jgi:hypothetical protein
MSKNLDISDKYRTNPLSLKEGGYSVTISYEDGSIFTYDKVKNPGRYIQSITVGKHGNIKEIQVDGVSRWLSGVDRINPWDLKYEFK